MPKKSAASTRGKMSAAAAKRASTVGFSARELAMLMIFATIVLPSSTLTSKKAPGL